ncbi:putative membrane protein [Paucibacter oligotrophus]|uniref:Putative membrane protein n=1 Tax=Roseateles oligotrophus TaxID=1769250 RepID=A0A840LCA9_9BURK|nr:NnrU family protein [Roseateles oligotrophus]MBB4842957.1 putative membrane protein [Roseateles oligotrophus]
MLVLITGLLVFLGVHSVRIVADDWRGNWIARHGDKPWKLAYTALSLLGFALIVYGYGLARQTPLVLWATPRGMNHLAALLTLLSFVLLVAAYVPRNAFKTRLQHPMMLSVKVWALAHLLANNTLADVLLFGSFLLWAMLAFRAARQRDRLNPPAALQAKAGATLLSLAVGLAAWAAFALWSHQALIGVRPFG